MKHPADNFPLAYFKLIPSYLCEASQLHAYLEGWQGGPYVPVPPIIVPGTIPKISGGTTLNNF